MMRPVHQSADLFPMMTDEDLADLAADIKANGLIHPIVVDKDGFLIDGGNRARACEIAGIEPATVLFEGDDPRSYIIASNIARRHMSKGQQAMAVAMMYPEPAKTKRKGSGSLEPKELGISGARLSQARTVLACSTDLARAVIAGSKALDAAYDEAKKAKRQVDAEDAAKTRREARRRRMKQSAGGPGDSPEVTRDKAFKRQAGEALRLAHENELAPMNPKVVIRAAKSEITETHVKAAREVAQAWDHVAKQLERLRGDCDPDAARA
jgi:ParB-like nuclease domain